MRDNRTPTDVCGEATLEANKFSSEYWKWQHRYFMDAVEQFGPPSLFITISPVEWTFPSPPWLDNLRSKTGKSPRNIPTLETCKNQNLVGSVGL